ncbi:hypothetical protein JVT61DRAFT_11838 [Boletus reticuloceps]|uniref:Uncharacterized protein n=1 Tax=Boletus reticuloceps TaxID=495285 RepID=A0A8I2YU43_9AGAM|nr:hypothetical protein JVT61DRAFT_11838 [Boletus reticuloceps]
MANPHHEPAPNFLSAAFRAGREAIMANDNVDQVEAAARMLADWNAEHERDIVAWDQQQEDAQRAAELADNERREEEAEERRLAEEDAEKEHQEAEKKKPKMADFTSGLPPPNVLIKRPSQYALTKLASFDFVELWYFSPEGCNDAAKHLKSSTDDAFGISSSNDFLTLRPVASVKASQYVRADHQLTFGEFLQARVSYLDHIKQASWPGKHINALAMFFWNLESHPHRVTTHGDLIILNYASRVRRQWHDDLKRNTGACDISIISDTLMNNIAWEINDAMNKRAPVRSVLPTCQFFHL